MSKEDFKRLMLRSASLIVAASFGLEIAAESEVGTDYWYIFVPIVLLGSSAMVLMSLSVNEIKRNCSLTRALLFDNPIHYPGNPSFALLFGNSLIVASIASFMRSVTVFQDSIIPALLLSAGLGISVTAGVVIVRSKSETES